MNLVMDMVVVGIVIFNMLECAGQVIATAHSVNFAVVRVRTQHIGEVLLISQLLLLVLHELLRDRHLRQTRWGNSLPHPIVIPN
jgi:hypothetical protein